VPEDEELRSLLISEFHDSKYAGHFGMSRTRVAVGRMFWWKSLAGDVAKYVSTCVACQRNKARRHKPYGLIQPLHVPEKPWHTVTFDSIVKLPVTAPILRVPDEGTLGAKKHLEAHLDKLLEGGGVKVTPLVSFRLLSHHLSHLGV
jgi:hypothetical protein